jgi:hypothetical protein
MAAQTRRTSKYPRFERRGEVLLRLGWDECYERPYVISKTPKYAVEALVSRILDVCDVGRNFTKSELRHLCDIEFGAISEREANLALSWLVSSGLVDRFSRGYQVRQNIDLLNDLENEWKRIPIST